MQSNKILKLTLSKQPFDVMKSGEKKVEIRRPSKWIKSRLYNKNGSLKKYDFVQFTNGYGKNKPMFVAEYKGFYIANEADVDILNFSNGLCVEVNIGDIVICLGTIINL